MSINNPPKYRYPLFDEWDKKTFELIKTLARDKKYPRIVGPKEDRNRFLTTLVRTQKSLHDWRALLVDVVEEVKETESISTKIINEKYPPESIGKDVPAWVTYEEDKHVSDFIDELESRKVDFVGSDAEAGEFVLRFILGQLGNDWELTILMIREMLGADTQLSLKLLNEELKNFDYVKLFE